MVATIGQTHTTHDLLDPARAMALYATLGLGDRWSCDDPLVPFGHHIYFWNPLPSTDLGADGHPRVGQGLIPDLGLSRRMWAGGALEFHKPLRLGEPAIKTSTLTNVQVKQGRTGKLGFVELTHKISQNNTLCITERQDLVYREPAAKSAARKPIAASQAVEHTVAVHFDPTTLFRYSALTLNGHRIHYDIDYARQIEGYDGLIVHGPLLAQHLLVLAQQQMGSIAHFAFRATAPLICGEAAELCWNSTGDMWVRGPDGRQIMTATAQAH